MKKIIKKILRPPYQAIKLLLKRLIPEKVYLKRKFNRRLGYGLDLDNPKTMNEKIQWLKINNRSPLHTLCADKYAVRRYVKEKVGKEYLVPLVYHTENPTDIIPENLPDFPFIIKTNHDCGGNIIVRNKADTDWKNVQKLLSNKIKRNCYDISKEWSYKNIKPCIIAEKLLLDENENIPWDYKLHCFDGKVRIISVTIDRFGNQRRNFYNENWEFQPFVWGCPPSREKVPNLPAPKKLKEMIYIAEKLASDLLYVRVDLYDVINKIFFGEMTFYPGSGFVIFSPFEWDTKTGAMLELPR